MSPQVPSCPQLSCQFDGVTAAPRSAASCNYRNGRSAAKNGNSATFNHNIPPPRISPAVLACQRAQWSQQHRQYQQMLGVGSFAGAGCQQRLGQPLHTTGGVATSADGSIFGSRESLQPLAPAQQLTPDLLVHVQNALNTGQCVWIVGFDDSGQPIVVQQPFVASSTANSSDTAPSSSCTNDPTSDSLSCAATSSCASLSAAKLEAQQSGRRQQSSNKLQTQASSDTLAETTDRAESLRASSNPDSDTNTEHNTEETESNGNNAHYQRCAYSDVGGSSDAGDPVPRAPPFGVDANVPPPPDSDDALLESAQKKVSEDLREVSFGPEQPHPPVLYTLVDGQVYAFLQACEWGGPWCTSADVTTGKLSPLQTPNKNSSVDPRIFIPTCAPPRGQHQSQQQGQEQGQQQGHQQGQQQGQQNCQQQSSNWTSGTDWWYGEACGEASAEWHGNWNWNIPPPLPPTTICVSGLPPNTSRKGFQASLGKMGFGRTYDFIYIYVEKDGREDKY